MNGQAPSPKRPPLADFLADPSWRCAVVAHRGAWHGAPENSLSSVDLAIARGYEFVEIDVQATSDGAFICLHDDTVDRMTGQPGSVAGMTAAELTGLCLKDKAGGAGNLPTAERPALLGDLLDRLDKRIYVDVDVKHLKDLEPVCAFLRTHPGRHHLNLKTPVQTEADLRFMDDLERQTGLMVKPVMRIAAETLDLFLAMLSARPMPQIEGLFDRFSTFELFARAALKSGTDLFLNTLDEVPSAEVTDTASLADPDSGWGRLLDHGARILQTDRPDALKAYAAKRKQSAGASV